MTTSHKRGIAEDKERAAATLPTQKWWISLAIWVPVALGVGLLYRFLAPAVGTDQVADKWTLLRYALSLILNSVAMYGISYFAARQTLARRSLKEIWKSESNKDALNRGGLPALLTIAALAVIVGASEITESLSIGLIVMSTLFSVYRALTTAYTAHYFDYVLSPVESREFTNDRALKGKKRLAAERVAITAGLYYPRQRLMFPLLQSVIVTFAFTGLMSLIAFSLQLDAENASPLWLELVSPGFLVISVFLWGIWHLHGGIGKMLRISSGRPMKGFGWQHPEFLKAGK